MKSCLTSRAGSRRPPAAPRFPATFRRAREQQTGEIHAREQNHKRTHGREHSSEGENRIRNIGNEQAGFAQPDTAADVHRIIPGELRGQRLERSFRLRERQAGLQPADGEEIVRSRLSSHLFPGSIVFAIIIGMYISGS